MERVFYFVIGCKERENLYLVVLDIKSFKILVEDKGLVWYLLVKICIMWSFFIRLVRINLMVIVL